MPYADENLSPGEKIRYRAKVHWSIYISTMLTLGIGIFVWLSQRNGEGVPILLILSVAGLYLFLRALLYTKTIELVITNQRVIAKKGFVRRNTIEQRLETVDNVGVHQSGLQRLFNAGSVRITGSGASQTPIRDIESPLYFRRKVNNAIDALNHVPSRLARGSQ